MRTNNEHYQALNNAEKKIEELIKISLSEAIKGTLKDETIRELEAEVSSLEYAVSALEDDVANLEDKVAGCEADLEEFKG